MSKLLAPNGKPSRLNSKQYKLVRTSAFKKWFGDWEKDPENASKVIDSNGEPLIVFHGSPTGKRFNSFKSKYNLFFFASEKNVAKNQYSSMSSDGLFLKDSRVFDIFLNIRNPYRIDAENREYCDINQDFDNENYEILEDLAYSVKNYQIEDDEEENENETPVYDGLIAKRVDEEQMFGAYGKTAITDVYVSFNPNQIKIADGTNTTFDNSNVDIRFDEGGGVEDKNYINTIRNCLIAQNYSDSAKHIEIYDDELHYKQINKIWSNNRLSIFQMKDLLYEDKNKFIERAISSAKKTNIKIIVGLDEKGYNVIYFEFPFGQVSFHLRIDEDKLDVLLKKHKNIIYDENYKWSGFTNSGSLLINEWKKMTNTKYNYSNGGDLDYSNFKTSIIGLVNDNKVLILKRGSTANWMPNKWSLVGGVVDNGEEPTEAIMRECFEEIGLEPINVSFSHKIMTNDSGEIYYFNGELESQNVKLDYENSTYKFITKDEINNYDFVPYIKEFIIDIFSKKINDTNINFNNSGEVNTGLFSQIWEWFGIKF